MKKWAFLMMAAVLLVTAACGSAEKTSPQAVPAAAQTEVKSGAPTAQAEAKNSAQESTVDQIKKRGKLIIGTSGTFRPMTFMNEKGELAGVDIEIGNRIAEKLGVKVEWSVGNLAGLIPALIAEKSDLVMFSTTMNPDRKEVIDFSEKYTSLGTVAVVKESNAKVKDVTELGGLVIGVIGGSGAQTTAQQIGGYKEMKEYPGHGEAIADLKLGRIDVYVAGSIAAYDYIKNDKGGEPLKVVGKLYNELDIGVGIRKNEPELKNVVDSVIQEMKQDGSLQKLLDKWIG